MNSTNLMSPRLRPIRPISAMLLAWMAVTAFCQNAQPTIGIPDDLSHRHLIFSDPGTIGDAMMHGSRAQWERINNSHRYEIQQLHRSADPVGWLASHHPYYRSPIVGHGPDRRREPSLSYGDNAGEAHRDWSVNIAAAGNGVSGGMYPAKYSFVTTTASCSDYVVFPVNAAGSTSQANIVGYTNLYKTTCNTGSPTVLFAYQVGTGTVSTSPALSEDGTKIAFVESKTNGSIFHVVTIGTTGSNGTAYNSPKTPGTGNNAVNVSITLSGNVNVSRSSPFIDYDGDTAYVGDDTGKLHQITGVFYGTPTETVSSGKWPFSVDTQSTNLLTMPVYDSVTQHIFVGGNYGSGDGTGKLYCATTAGAACSTASITVGTGLVDAPIVDSTAGMIYEVTYNGTITNSIAFQAPLSFATSVSATVGPAITGLNNGTFDNAYYTSPSTGHFYVCGNSTVGGEVLYRVSFTGTTMKSTADTSTFTLVGSQSLNTACTPLTEVYNTSTSTDLLFVGVQKNSVKAPSTGTAVCNGGSCLFSFNITSGFPTAPLSDYNPAGTVTGAANMSAVIIDNTAATTGASQIYFGNITSGTGVQLSQSGLQ